MNKAVVAIPIAVIAFAVYVVYSIPQDAEEEFIRKTIAEFEYIVQECDKKRHQELGLIDTPFEAWGIYRVADSIPVHLDRERLKELEIQYEGEIYRIYLQVEHCEHVLAEELEKPAVHIGEVLIDDARINIGDPKHELDDDSEKPKTDDEG